MGATRSVTTAPGDHVLIVLRAVPSSARTATGTPSLVLSAGGALAAAAVPCANGLAIVDLLVSDANVIAVARQPRQGDIGRRDWPRKADCHEH
jgi:hypothetical protein